MIEGVFTMNKSQFETVVEQVIELTRTMMSLAHEVKLVDERLHDLEVKYEKDKNT